MPNTSWEMLGWMSYKLESRWGEQHKQSQICGWYHSICRKQRETKEPLDEGEGGKWKIQLKGKYLKKKKTLRSWHPAPSLHANRRGKGESSDKFPLFGLQHHYRWWLQPWNQKTIAFWQESDDKPRQCVEKQRHYSTNKDLYSHGYGFPCGRVWL